MLASQVLRSLIVLTMLHSTALAEDAAVTINKETLELPNQSVVTFTNRKSVATVSADGQFRGTLTDGGSGGIQLDVSAKLWTFDGIMKAASGTSKTRFMLKPSSHVIIGEGASINQQMPGMIMARPI